MPVFENMEIRLDPSEMGKTLLVHKTGEWDRFRELLKEAESVIRPKAVYVVRYIDEKTEDQVIIGGTPFSSRVLSRNLEAVGRVFPYVVSIGPGLERMADESEDLLEKYYLDTFGTMALVEARKRLEKELENRFAVNSLSFMSPGSLKDWPIEEQRPLFSILGGAETSIGVRLNRSLLMIPKKSVSGIYFPTEVRFYNCQLCHREQCDGRKAPYDKGLADRYGVT